MNPATLKQIVMHAGDSDIKKLLLDNGVVINPPEPPSDLSIITARDARHVWLVMRFFHPGDEGYLAFGLPIATPESEVRNAFAFLLEPYQGKLDRVVMLPPLAVN